MNIHTVLNCICQIITMGVGFTLIYSTLNNYNFEPESKISNVWILIGGITLVLIGFIA